MKKIKNYWSNVLFVSQRMVIGSLLFLTLASCELELFGNDELTGRKYYVRTAFENEDTQRGEFSNLKKAKGCADLNAVYGYRVYSASGNVVYSRYGELVADILREGKWVADYVRENNFKYGDAPINPAIDHTAKLVSCDRLVGWTLYRAGFTNQPYKSGLWIWAPGNERDLEAWCKLNQFERIAKQEDLLPGDVVFVSRKIKDQQGHTFIYAGASSDSLSYRYDGGSDKRIQSVQPSIEPIHDFMFAYRPVRK